MSEVILGFELVGGEIADQTLRVRRKVWADDPADLGSALRYTVEVVDDAEAFNDEQTTGTDIKPAARRVLALLTDNPQTVRDLGDGLAGDGRPLKARTIQASLAELSVAGLADSLDAGPRGTLGWVRHG